MCLSFDLIACQISSSCRLSHCTRHCASSLRPHLPLCLPFCCLWLQLIDNSSDWHINRGHNVLPCTRHRLRRHLSLWYSGIFVAWLIYKKRAIIAYRTIDRWMFMFIELSIVYSCFYLFLIISFGTYRTIDRKMFIECWAYRTIDTSIVIDS